MIVAPSTATRTNPARRGARPAPASDHPRRPPKPPTRRGTGLNDAARKLSERVEAASAGMRDALVWRTRSDEVRAEPISSRCYELDLEGSLPIRIAYRWTDRTAYSGQHWFSPTATSLYYESMTERLGMIQLAYHFNRADLPDIVAASSQPMRLPSGPGKGCYPDLMCRFSDGTKTVFEVKPRGMLKQARREKFERAQDICTRVGWHHQAILEPLDVVEYNLDALALFRHPRLAPTPDLQAKIVDLCQVPRPFQEVVDALSSPSHRHVSTHLLHLLWMRVVDPVTLQEPLDWDVPIVDPHFIRTSNEAL
jgi:hypothetical protein